MRRDRTVHRSLWVIACGMLLLLLSGCGGGADEPSAGAPAATPSSNSAGSAGSGGGGNSNASGGGGAAPQGPAEPATEAGSQPLEPVTVKIFSCCVSGTETALWVALDNGLFEKYGVKPEFAYLPSPTNVQALMAGDVQIGTAPGSTIEARASGNEDLVFVAGNVSKAVYRLMAKPEYSSPEQLRGKTIGISGRYSAPAVALIDYLEREHGMKADVDYKLSPFRVISDILPALQEGLVDAGIQSTPLYLKAEESGFKVLIDLAGKIDQANAYVLTRRSIVERDREGLLRFLRAYIEGIATVRENQELAVASIVKHTQGTSEEFARATYDDYAQRHDPNMYLEAFEPYQRHSNNPKTAEVNVLEMLDFSLLQELEQEGFLAGHGIELKLPEGVR